MFLKRRDFINIILIIWIVLWVNFIARDFYKIGKFAEYKDLLRCDTEGKRSRTYGARFYEFLKFAKNSIPEDSIYDFVGVNDFSLESRRGIYYLYPRLKKEGPRYLLIYDEAGFQRKGFSLYAKLDGSRFILKRD